MDNGLWVAVQVGPLAGFYKICDVGHQGRPPEDILQ